MRYLKDFSKILPLSLKVQLFTLFNKRQMTLGSNKRALIFLAADYGNIGDIAITLAQKNFLAKVLNGFEIISIPISQTRLVIDSIKQQISPADIITIVGGGNMGASYPDIEALRQLVIRTFPSNRVVCFPQTLDCSYSKKSTRALARIIKTYSRHPDLHIFARESISFAKLHEVFGDYPNVSVDFVPDIVMTTTAKVLGATDCQSPTGILSCLRNDKEAALTAAQYNILDAALMMTGQPIKKTDTHVGGSQLSEARCSELLADKLSQFRSAKLVVTDRLHGMILSLLTGTPCLVMSNANHKISQTWFDWLQDHPRLIFVEQAQFDHLSLYLDKLLNTPKSSLSESPVSAVYYTKLTEALVKL